MSESASVDKPQQQRLRMPPEWHRHDCTWMSWPHNQQTWPNNLKLAQDEFVDLVYQIACDENVVVLIPDEASMDQFNNVLVKRPSTAGADHIHTLIVPTNDAWIRDYGPTFATTTNQLVAVDWQYNAWGGKYPPFDDDQKVAERMLVSIPNYVDQAGVSVLRQPSSFCFEGGAIEIDDRQVLMSTRSCAMDSNRNPTWSLEQIEREFRNHLGAQEFIWLAGNAISGDDTDGHIDQLARFVPDGKIVYATGDSDDARQREALQENFVELERAVAKLDQDYELVALPLPPPVYYGELRLPASYCNFYITNASVLVPQFQQPASDERAVRILRDLFPGWTVIGLPSYNLSVGLGSFHCLTQQQPAVL